MSSSVPSWSAPSPGLGVVIDSSALLALGSGHQWLSRLIVGALGRPGSHVVAPAMCLAAAAARRPRLGDHIGGLGAITIFDLGFSDACTVGVLIAAGADWQHAHAVACARPSLEWPAGLPVATTTPAAYDGHDLRIIDLTAV